MEPSVVSCQLQIAGYRWAAVISQSPGCQFLVAGYQVSVFGIGSERFLEPFLLGFKTRLAQQGKHVLLV